MALATWDLWIPDVASRGISFARAVMESADTVIVHSAPTLLRVEVRDAKGAQVAFGDNLKRTGDSPMTKLTITGDRVTREDFWPGVEDNELPVILPGGDVGILKSWSHAPDHSSWRWTLELSNHR